MNILVTGSSGTIGTHLCEQLLKEKHKVIGVDRKSNKWNKKISRITINIDLRDKLRVLSALPRDVDIIIHLAANARVHDLVTEPSLARDNFEILFNTLEYARKNNIKRFIFASSREVYGNIDSIVLSENEASTKNCESPYSASKIGGEALVRSYWQCYGINFCIVRYSNVYGMYDESNRIVPLFIRRCRANEDLIIFGKDKLLDFTHITDAVSGTMLLIDKFNIIKNEIYNLATGDGVSLLDLAELIKTETNSSSQIHIMPSRTGEVIRYVADVSKIKAATRYTPKISIEEGIKRSLIWYQKNILQ